ncbi:MAG: phosphotransferase, partial [Erysipelotrichaceae bacterium]
MALFATCTGLTATSIAPFGGMTNQNYLVTTAEGNFILRIAGAKTECFISRSAEGYNSLLAYLLGLNVYPYFFESQTGIKITKFVEGSYTLQPEQLRKDRLSEVAALLQHLHRCPYPLQGDFALMEEFKKYEMIVGYKQDAYYEGYAQAKAWVVAWMDAHHVHQLPCVPCHNDLVLENLLVGEKLMLIDWEYAGNNHAAFDLASFVREADLTLSQQALFLEAYYGRVVTSEEQDLVRFYGIAQDVLWS